MNKRYEIIVRVHTPAKTYRFDCSADDLHTLQYLLKAIEHDIISLEDRLPKVEKIPVVHIDEKIDWKRIEKLLN